MDRERDVGNVGKGGGGCNKSRSNSGSGGGWISVARMSGVIRVKVFCCVLFGIDWVFFLEYKCPKRWFPGFFCSVGRSVDDK